MKGLIISSGYINNYILLGEIVDKYDYIICADGGVDHIINTDKIPNIIIGDLDSISKEGLKYIEKNNIKTLKYPIMKDETDTELALLYLINKGFKEITLMGVTGTRIDHTMANILLLRKLGKGGIKGKIIDDHNIIHFIDEYIKIKKREDMNISIIPLSNDGIVVSLKGFLYPLENKFIDFGSTMGISNEIIEEYGSVFINKGEALVIESRD